MSILRLQSYAEGRWHVGTGTPAEVASAITGAPFALIDASGIDMGAALQFARLKGGAALRKLDFHQRASLLKQLALYLSERKEALYQLSFDTGATRTDSWIDIDGGIGTLQVFASKGRRELPPETFLIDGAVENLSKTGTFRGQHVYVPRHGVAVQINAFNFPVWGLLEKLAPAILSGMPVIAKPASATAWLAEALARMIVESRILPEAAFQFIAGSTGDLFDHLTGQDLVSFTGSLETSVKLQAHPVIAREAVRFVAERDSLNSSILGEDVTPDAPEFDLFVKEVAREMTVKAGQKCTAIRRIIVPEAQAEAVSAALAKRLAGVTIGDPRLETTRMGPLASLVQRADVRMRIDQLRKEAEIVSGNPDHAEVTGADTKRGAFIAPMLLRARDAMSARLLHE
ncbi:MAG: 3,4-dehydroadipyl-CoA semialdehyde dehydrogenase, partial [Bosea sp. (in: a-proteobacteria)]